MSKWFLLILIIVFSACGSKTARETAKTTIPQSPSPEEIYPKNIILMIGDGMGIAQISASIYLKKGKHSLENFPVVGLQKTHSGNNLVTDSAAGATAIACGIKTFNDAVGVDMDTLPVQSILELSKEKGLATGIVVTSTVVHATPAAFYAHQSNRYDNEDIALDFMKSEIDFMIGGGKKYFDNRPDDINLYKQLKDKKVNVSSYFEKNIFDLNFFPKNKYVFFTANEDPVGADSGRDYLPYISVVGAKYLKKRGKKGFFMMIEGSQIDWAGHSQNGEKLIYEMSDFEKTIGKILKFAKKDKETLVIVTADHECGGFAINPGSTNEELVPAFTYNMHTADMVPVFAYGPQAELFHGVYDNTDIYQKMKQALQLD